MTIEAFALVDLSIQHNLQDLEVLHTFRPFKYKWDGLG